MKKTEEMILDKELWAGLNKPDAEISDVDIVVFGIAFDKAASVRSGTEDGPKAIRNLTYSITPTTEDFESFETLKVKDLGDFKGDDQVALFKEVEDKVAMLVKEKKFFTMLGGDHSVTIPVVRGINREIEEDFGIIHIDAHFDLNDTLGGNNLSHGCPARRASELDKVKGSENIFFIGIRSIEMDEIEFMKNNTVNVISARRFSEMKLEEVMAEIKSKLGNKKHIYLTLDIDCLDPAYAAGTGTPQFGGLYSRELLNLLREISKEFPLIGFDVVEVAPNLDPALTSVYAARKIITEMWGFQYNKINK